MAQNPDWAVQAVQAVQVASAGCSFNHLHLVGYKVVRAASQLYTPAERPSTSVGKRWRGTTQQPIIVHMQQVEQDQIGPIELTEEREDIQELASATEALLFASAEPLELSDLRRVLAVRQPTLDRALDYLARSLSEGKRGIRLQRHAGMVRLVTAPEMALYVTKMRGEQANQRLSD